MNNILNKYSNIVGGADVNYIKDSPHDLLINKIEKIQNEMLNLTRQTEKLNLQKKELLNKIVECDKKIKQTEQIINNLTQNNKNLQEETKTITEIISKKITDVINLI